VRKILVIDRENEFRKTLTSYLSEYFEVQSAASPEAGWSAIVSWQPDVVVVGSTATAGKEIDLLKSVRNEDTVRHVGLVVLTQEKSLMSEESLFLRGADTLISRETAPNSLVLRISALLQRIDGFQSLQDSKITFGTVVIDPRSKQVENNGIVIELTPTQFALLFAFACHQNQILTRRWLQQNIWKSAKVSPRSIDAHISKLKKILPSLQELLVNVYGEGYLLMPAKKAA
jgi:DNA-binding response OmpR family regulator